MKKLLIVLGAVVVVAVAALAALPFLIPAESIRDRLVAEVEKSTGRRLVVAGPVSVGIWPSLSVQVGDVRLSNPPGFAEGDVLRLGGVDLRLKLMPLLSGEAVVDAFVLEDVALTLHTDRQGRNNWTFAAKDGGGKGGAAGGGDPLGDLRLGDVRVVNGSVVVIDDRDGSRQEFQSVDLAVSLPSLDAPLSARGDVRWNGRDIELDLSAARPRAMMDGGASPVTLALASAVTNLTFQGEVRSGDKAGLAGDVVLTVPSVRDLAAWLGSPVAAAGDGLGRLTMQGRLEAAPGRVGLVRATVAMDALTASGDLALDATKARPLLRASLALGVVDLNPYLPPEGQAESMGQGGAGAAAGDWSDAPIDVSVLRAMDADVALTVEGIRVRRLQIGQGAVTAKLAGGRLALDLERVALYGGAGSGRLVVDGATDAVGIDARASLAGVQAEPLLADFAEFRRLTGTGAAEIKLAGRGASERAIVSSLAGGGRIDFRDGAIKGINLAAMLRNVTTAFADTGGTQQTDFTELGGTFTVAKGIVVNRDLALKSPLLRVEGAGTVDLPRRQLSYRITPKVVASLQGQGGQDQLSGVIVPVIVEGPWANPQFRPDLAGLVQQRVEGQLGKMLQGLAGQPSPSQPAPAPDAGAAPAAGEPTKPMLPFDPGRLFRR